MIRIKYHNQLLYAVTFLLYSLFSTPLHADQNRLGGTVDLVLYSYNRPMQLYAYLESIEKFLTGYGQVSVIYRASNDDYTQAYEEVVHDFPWIHFFKQGPNPYQDFKPLVQKCAFETPSDYVSFGVDDIIVKDYTDLRECTAALEKAGAYAFYLRLGKNIDHCFMLKIYTPVPAHTQVADGIFMWKFADGQGDWIYPNCNDMAVYRKSDIYHDLMSLNFVNTLYEGYWCNKADLNKKGLFFAESRIVNTTMNVVEMSQNYSQFTNEWKQKINLYTTQKLLEKFNAGLKIDIRPYKNLQHNAPHIEREQLFIERRNDTLLY